MSAIYVCIQELNFPTLPFSEEFSFMKRAIYVLLKSFFFFFSKSYFNKIHIEVHQNKVLFYFVQVLVQHTMSLSIK